MDSYDQLPKPEPGHLLLNSFAETGVDYYMTENPDADNEAIESLGFYNPPAGALRAIFGDEYDGSDIDFTLPSAGETPLPDEAAGEGAGTEGGRRRRRSRGKGRSQSGPAAEGDKFPAEVRADDTQGDAPDAGEDAPEEQGGAKPRRRRPRRRRRPAGDAPDGQANAESSRPAEEGPAPSATSASTAGQGSQQPESARRRRPRRRRPSGNGGSADGIRTRESQPFYGEAE